MLGRVFSNEPLTPSTTAQESTDEMLKESAEELIIKDLKELENELNGCESVELK